MKYYVPEHEAAYAELQARGLSAWGQLHGERTFEDSQIRSVLEAALPHAVLPTAIQPRALEYGCGTGPGTCLLAARGMRVDGVDLSPVAIDIARREAAARGLDVRYAVLDVCAAEPPAEPGYDLVVDSFCLQSIVTDADRARLLAFARAALRAEGCFVVATAGFHPSRDYGECLFDEATGTVLEPVGGATEHASDVVSVNGRRFVPCRRHITLDALVRELGNGGFVAAWHHTWDSGDHAVVARHPAAPP